MIRYPRYFNTKGDAMNIKYIVTLNDKERQHLEDITSKGKSLARVIQRAHILLMSDKRQHKDNDIAEFLSVSEATIYRTKRNFVDFGLEAALEEGSRIGRARKLDANQEAMLVSLACSEPPAGSCRWTLSLLAGELIALTDIDPVSTDTVRRRLKENDLKPWQKKMWCIGSMNADYVAQMEHILDLYAEPEDELRPIVNFDEAGKQLVGHVKEPLQTKPASVAKEDYEYKREGVENIYMFFDRHRGWRKVKVTETKKAVDFAECMRELVDQHYPNADTVRVVLDNLNTHCAGSLYKAFPAEEARRILKRLEFHHTPKHASWLNMVEIEIGNMNQQCLDRRIDKREILIAELSAWEERRNQERASINWMFNVDKAREKLTKAYDRLNQS